MVSDETLSVNSIKVKHCEICGTVFLKPVNCSKSDWFRRRYCSHHCQTIGNGRSHETQRKNAAAHRGRIPWNKGRRCPEMSGDKHPMFGKCHRPESIELMRKAQLGKVQSPEVVQKRVISRSGYRHSPETKTLIRQTNLLSWSRQDVRAKVTGQNSPSWQGGKSKEPYSANWNYALRESIRERDGRRCRCCGKTESENKHHLCVHHVDYDKQNSDEANLVSLCDQCHKQTIHNRLWLQQQGILDALALATRS